MSKRTANPESSTTRRTQPRRHWPRFAWLVPLLALLSFGGPQTGEAAGTCTAWATDDWHNPDTWDCAAVPTAEDHVIIPNLSTVFVNAPAVAGSLAATGGSLRFTAGSSLDVAGDFDNGVLSVEGPGTITIAGAFVQTTAPGFVAGYLGLGVGANLVLNGPSTLELGQVSLSPGGTMVINSTFVIGAGAEPLAFPSFGEIHIGPGGQLSRGGVGMSSIQNPVTNAGTVAIAASETLNFLGGYLQSAGLTEIADGGVLQGAPVINGGVLRGAGQVTGGVTNNGGTVEPGASPGTLFITGDYAQGPGGTLAIDIDGTVQGTQYDHLDVAGAATLGGTVAVTFGAGFAPSPADSFEFLTSGSRIGTFASVTGATASNGHSFVLEYPGGPEFGAALGGSGDVCMPIVVAGSWHVASSWDCGKVPGSADHAILPQGFGFIVIQGPVEVGSLSLDSQVHFDPGGSLSVVGDFSNKVGYIWGPGTVTVGGAFSQHPGSFGFGDLSLVDGGQLVLNGSSTFNTGFIAIGAGSRLTINNTFVIGAGADEFDVIFGLGELHIGPQGHLSREGVGTTEIWIETTNLGTVSVANGQLMAFGTFEQAGGTVEIAEGGFLEGPMIISGGTLRGEGYIVGPVFNNAGTVAPGGPAVGNLVIDSYFQGPGGTLAIDVAGTAPGTGYDHLETPGGATLDGTVAVTFAPGFEPSPFDTFDFLTSFARIGTFTSLTGSIAPNGTILGLDYPADSSVRLIGSEPVLPDVVVDLLTSQELLDAILAVPGSVVMVNVDGREFLIIPNMTNVGGDVTLSGNATLIAVDLSALQSVGGNIQVNGNLAMTTLDISAMETVAGDLIVSGNPLLNALLVSGVTSIGGDLSITFNDSLSEIDLGDIVEVEGDLVISDNAELTTVDLSSLTTVNGDLVIIGNPDLTVINMSNLTTVSGEIIIAGNPSLTTVNLGDITTASGDLTISGNTVATTVNIGELTTVSGDLDITDNSAATVIDMSSLTTVSGDLTLTDNTAATTVNIGNLETVGGNLDIGGNTGATTVNIGELTTVSGDLDITDNSAATIIDMSSLTTVSGDLTLNHNTSATYVDISGLTTATGDVTITDNGGATEVNIGNLETVGGNLTVDSNGGGTFDVGLVSPDGDANISAGGYDGISGTTAGGDTTVGLAGAEAIMTAQLLALAFVTPVEFSIVRNDPATLEPTAGVGADGLPATIEPVSAYTFTFGVPTLNRPATLSFDILLSGLDPVSRDAVLAALANGSVTMATQGDASGASYRAFPTCVSGELPEAEGCVLIELLDAAGTPTAGEPAIIRLTNIVGHFSTWAVVIVTPTDEPEPDPELPPTLTLPGDLAVDATSHLGTVVQYAASAADAAGAPLTPVCTPAPGSTFAIGTTTVTCTATSATGAPAAGTFAVHVAGAGEQLADLHATTLSYVNQPGLRLALSILLRTAANAEAANRPRTACTALTVYSLTVWFAPSRELTFAEKVELTNDARRIQDVMGCR